jgi:membrane protein YdbS with pleckstrin-like domain
VLVFVLVVGVGTAAWDAVYGSWGNTVASAIYLVALVVELFWVPKWQERLLDNADRAADKVPPSDPADQPSEIE